MSAPELILGTDGILTVNALDCSFPSPMLTINGTLSGPVSFVGRSRGRLLAPDPVVADLASNFSRRGGPGIVYLLLLSAVPALGSPCTLCILTLLEVRALPTIFRLTPLPPVLVWPTV